MTEHKLQPEIEELQARGWQVETTNQALVMQRRFPSFSESLEYLVDLKDLTAAFDATPSIRIEGGTEVNVRVGREPAPGLTAVEIRLAQALTVNQ